jgi:hypothetical protein
VTPGGNAGGEPKPNEWPARCIILICIDIRAGRVWQSGSENGQPVVERLPAGIRWATLNESLQLRVLRLGLLQDGDVGVGVFPEGQEILVGSLGLGRVTLQDLGAGKTH